MTTEPGSGSWAKIRWPNAPEGSVGSRPEHPPDRVARARRRGEAQFNVWSTVFAVIIAVGYGSLIWAGLLTTWFKWPTLAAVAFVLWRNRPRRRRQTCSPRRCRPGEKQPSA